MISKQLPITGEDMIYVNKDAGETVSKCDVCGEVSVSSTPNGVAPEGWMTGQLWLDVSLTQQRQTPICFCTTCAPRIAISEDIRFLADGEV